MHNMVSTVMFEQLFVLTARGQEFYACIQFIQDSWIKMSALIIITHFLLQLL